MVKIVSDSSILYAQEEAKTELDVITFPLIVTINGQTYREFEDIKSKEFIDIINEGYLPTSSQPSIGEKIEAYDALVDEHDVIDITMAQGLSGTYDSALTAKMSSKNPDKVTVFNSRTLCGPHKKMVEYAAKMAKEGKSKEDILNFLEAARNTEISFLIPFDFEYLVRGGRVSGAVGAVGGLLKLIAVMLKNEDGTRLVKHTIARTMKKAKASVVEKLVEHGCTSDYHFSVSHAFNEDVALQFKEALLERFPNATIDILLLSPAFITQGGPGCVAIQAIKL